MGGRGLDVKGEVWVGDVEGGGEVGVEEVLKELGGEGPGFAGVGVVVEEGATDRASGGRGVGGESLQPREEEFLSGPDAISLAWGEPVLEGLEGRGCGGGDGVGEV